MDFSNRYILGFTLTICLVCSLIVSTVAVGLKEQQTFNRNLDKQKNILVVSGLAAADEVLSSDRITELFGNIETLQVDRVSGKILRTVEFGSYDVVKAAKGEGSEKVKNKAYVSSLPKFLEVYRIRAEGKECWVLPIWGNGLWSTLLGYLALEPNGMLVRGITFYSHGETAGLGGEVDNPRWKGLWPGMTVFDPQGNLVLEVVKNGKVQDPSCQVDGLAGATITSVAVTYMLEVWLGDQGYGPFLAGIKGTIQ